jgi:hypothetical protein
MSSDRRKEVSLGCPLIARKRPVPVIIRENRFCTEAVQPIMKSERESNGFGGDSHAQHRRTNREIHGVVRSRLELRDTEEVERTSLTQQTVVNQDNNREAQ